MTKNALMQIKQNAYFFPLLTALLTLCAAWIPELLAPGFYFADDVRHYFIAPMNEIGHRLTQGEWPLLTLRSMYAGNLLGEGQLQLFNPLALLLYAVLAQIPDLADAMLFYSGFYLVLTALGIYFLARQFKLAPALALLAGVAFPLGSITSYWYASSWLNALATNAWLVWAMALLLHALANRRYFPWAVMLSAMVLSGGWPHGSIALLLFALVVCAQHQGIKKFPYRFFFAWGGLSLALSLPALLPLVAHVANGQRAQALLGNAGLMNATIDELLALSWPTFVSSLPHFFGPQSATIPHYYVAWFIAPLCLLCARSIKPAFAGEDKIFSSLLGLSLLFAFLSLGPQNLWVLRWQFRFFPYFGLFITLATLKLVSVHDWRLSLGKKHLLTLWILAFALCCQQAPNLILVHATFALLCFLGSWLAIDTARARLRLVPVLALSFLIYVLMHFYWPINENIGPWWAPKTLEKRDALPSALGNVLILRQKKSLSFDELAAELPSGNVAQFENRAFINGYSPIEPRALKNFLCFDLWTFSCPTALARLFERDPLTHELWVNLLRIGEIRAQQGVFTRTLQTLAADADFHLASQAQFSTVWKRDRDWLPGTLAWKQEHLSVSALPAPKRTSAENESFVVRNDSALPARLIWARLPFPGYELSLNGQALPLEEHDRLLLATTLPPGSSGLLELHYRPFGWRWTLPLALSALLLAFFYGLRRRDTADESRSCC
ncbi:MAG: hypothetical protein V4623_02895 [Pseudomonadota bacterium]